MKIVIIALFTIALSLTLYSFANPNADTYSLTIEVKNLRNPKGIVQFALYNKDGSIPDEDYENYYKILKGEIVNGSSTITFKNIPSGKDMRKNHRKCLYLYQKQLATPPAIFFEHSQDHFKTIYIYIYIYIYKVTKRK